MSYITKSLIHVHTKQTMIIIMELASHTHTAVHILHRLRIEHQQREIDLREEEEKEVGNKKKNRRAYSIVVYFKDLYGYGNAFIIMIIIIIIIIIIIKNLSKYIDVETKN